VDVVCFTGALQQLDAGAIRAIASDLTLLVSSPADEVIATKAVLVIEQSLHRSRRAPQAALAAHAAAQTVLAAAQRCGIELPDDDVTRVARGAATLARGLVAGPVVDRAVTFLASGFHRVDALHLAA
jgi:hypothetical protein